MQEFDFGSSQRLLNGGLRSLLVKICFPSDFDALTHICNGLNYVTQSPHKDRSPAPCARRSSPDQHHGQQPGSPKMALMRGETESPETNYGRYSISEQHECQKDQARTTPS